MCVPSVPTASPPALDRMPPRARDLPTRNDVQERRRVQDDSEELTSGQIEELQQSLVRHRRHRLDQLRALAAKPERTDAVGRAHREAVERILHEVDAALARVSENAFGLCQHCRCRLPFARLAQLPYARGCDPCVRVAAGW